MLGGWLFLDFSDEEKGPAANGDCYHDPFSNSQVGDPFI